MKVARNEKRKKLLGFSFSINIANFEAFWGVKKLSANLSFFKSAPLFDEFKNQLQKVQFSSYGGPFHLLLHIFMCKYVLCTYYLGLVSLSLKISPSLHV